MVNPEARSQHCRAFAMSCLQFDIARQTSPMFGSGTQHDGMCLPKPEKGAPLPYWYQGDHFASGSESVLRSLGSSLGVLLNEAGKSSEFIKS